MHKLSSIDLDPFMLRWICSYLMYREQYVVLNGERSATCKVTSGVPQGSVLGWLLFLIYIHDSVCSTALNGNSITLYADDLLLYRVVNSVQDYERVQEGVLNDIGRWVDENDLHLNVNLWLSQDVELKQPQSLC